MQQKERLLQNRIEGKGGSPMTPMDIFREKEMICKRCLAEEDIATLQIYMIDLQQYASSITYEISEEDAKKMIMSAIELNKGINELICELQNDLLRQIERRFV